MELQTRDKLDGKAFFQPLNYLVQFMQNINQPKRLIDIFNTYQKLKQKGLVHVGTTFRNTHWYYYRNVTRVYYLWVLRGALREKGAKA